MPAMTQEPVEEARTIAEAVEGHRNTLNLSNIELEAVPPDLVRLSFLESLNLSGNLLYNLPQDTLPSSLTHLDVSGCDLEFVPPCLSRLAKLKTLNMGANRISVIDVVFQCPALQHAGFAFNSVSSLSDASILEKSSMISIDLSDNDLTDIASVCTRLRTLPQLRNLNLKGNPICLLPSYNETCRDTLPDLHYFDGRKLDGMGSSKHSKSHSMASQDEVEDGNMRPSTPSQSPNTYLDIELTDLEPLEDPFREVKEMQAQAKMLEAGTATAEDKPVSFPLQPIAYHVELMDCTGTSYACIPLRIQPPVADVGQAVDPKKGGKPAAGGKTAAAAATPLASMPLIKRGALKLRLDISATTAWRNWLRKGIAINLICTKHVAVARPLAKDDESPPPPTPPSGAKKKAGGPPEPPPLPPFDIETMQEVMGSSVVQCHELCGGYVRKHQSSVSFVPIPKLWDSNGIRMGLEDDRHPVRPVASARVVLELQDMN